MLKTRVCRYDWPLWSNVQMYLITAEELAAASHVEVPSSVGTHPLFIPITAAPVSSFKDIKANVMFTVWGIALPVLIHAHKIILIATFAYNIHSVLGENVTVCILDGLKTLSPRTRGFAVAWEALRVISRPYTTNVCCYGKDWCIVTFKHLLDLQAVTVSWIGLESVNQVVFRSLLAPTAIIVTYSLLFQTLHDVVGKTYRLGDIQVCTSCHRIEDHIS